MCTNNNCLSTLKKQVAREKVLKDAAPILTNGIVPSLQFQVSSNNSASHCFLLTWIERRQNQKIANQVFNAIPQCTLYCIHSIERTKIKLVEKPSHGVEAYFSSDHNNIIWHLVLRYPGDVHVLMNADWQQSLQIVR